MEKRYQVEIKRLNTGKVKEVVDILAHSKAEARKYARIIYRVNKYANTVIGKATEYIYE